MLPEPSVTKATIPGGCHARGQPCAPGDLLVLLLCRAAGGSDMTTTDTTKAKGPFETRLLACHPAPSIFLKSNLAISKSATATGKGTHPTLALMVISAQATSACLPVSCHLLPHPRGPQGHDQHLVPGCLRSPAGTRRRCC